MSEIIVRPSTEEDLEGIACLFLPRKRDKNTLRWVLADPQGKLRSFVAVAEGRIVGHIGYVLSDYRYNDSIYQGVFTIEWLVDDDYAGQAGLMLYSKVLKLGDFTFVIGGTEVVNKIYPLLKFQMPLHVSKFLKVTKPFPYLKALKGKLWKKIAKTVFYSRGALISKPVPGNADITLAPYCGKSPDITSDRSVIVNAERQDHIDWLLKAPGMEAYPFTIQKSGDSIGTVLCYVLNTHGLLTGRIVHVSYLGRDLSLWRQVIHKAEQFLVKKGCCIITTFASDPLFVKALQDNGHLVTHQLPFWLKDAKKILSDASWHLTFLEGDLAYRGVYISDFVHLEQAINGNSGYYDNLNQQ